MHFRGFGYGNSVKQFSMLGYTTSKFFKGQFRRENSTPNSHPQNTPPRASLWSHATTENAVINQQLLGFTADAALFRM